MTLDKAIKEADKKQNLIGTTIYGVVIDVILPAPNRNLEEIKYHEYITVFLEVSRNAEYQEINF